jgi:DNA invertase Pin-like site-specific DNA recombinase
MGEILKPGLYPEDRPAGTLVEEVIESPIRQNRPALARALRLCSVHRATLVVAKLDRLARNVAFVSGLMESGVDFTAVDFPQANKLTVHTLAAMAQHEAEAISARTKAALARSKKKLGGHRWTVNRKGGRVRWDISKHAAKGGQAGVKVCQEQAAKRAADLQPVIEDIRKQGATTMRAIADGLNERGIPTACGGQWSAVQVQRLGI